MRSIIFDRFTERLGERRFARARKVFEQHVAVGEERGQDELDDVVTPAHRCAHAIEQLSRDPMTLWEPERAASLINARRRSAFTRHGTEWPDHSSSPRSAHRDHSHDTG